MALRSRRCEVYRAYTFCSREMWIDVAIVKVRQCYAGIVNIAIIKVRINRIVVYVIVVRAVIVVVAFAATWTGNRALRGTYPSIQKVKRYTRLSSGLRSNDKVVIRQ